MAGTDRATKEKQTCKLKSCSLVQRQGVAGDVVLP